MIKPYKFSFTLLYPRYWMIWFGFILLWLVVQLPYPFLKKIGSFLGRISKIFLKKRVRIARRNIELCFPNMEKSFLNNMINDNFSSLGMGLIETGMAWFWSDARVKKYFNVSGLQYLKEDPYPYNKGVIIIGVHFMSLELGGRAMGLCKPITAMYRPHNNKVINFIQTWGRMRSNKAMIDRKNLRGVVNALKKGEIVWFAPDHDYGPRGSIFVPFFSVSKAATTRGIYALTRLTQSKLIPVVFIRKKNNHGYKLLIQKPLKYYPQNNEIAATCYISSIIEQKILLAPEQYLWLHRRFKTRPKGETSLYA